MVRITRLIGILAVGVVCLGGILSIFSDAPPRGAPSGSVRSNLPTVRAGFDVFETPSEFSNDVRDATPMTLQAAGVTVTGDLVVALATWLLFLLLALVLWRRGSMPSRLSAVTVVVCASAAVALDGLESIRLHSILSTVGQGGDVVGAVHAAHQYAVAKWWWSFLATGAVAPLFFFADDIMMSALGGTLVGAVVTGACGLLWYPDAVEWAFAMLIPVDLGLALVCLSTPDLLQSAAHRA